MRLLVLQDKIPWFGAHTGYEQIVKYLSSLADVRTVTPRKGPVARYFGGLADTILRRQRAGPVTTSELELLAHRLLIAPDVTHFLYGDGHLRALRAGGVSRDVIATLHLPQQEWTRDNRDLLKRLGSAIVLYRRDMDFFEAHVGKGRVHFVRHGVDTEFFHPRIGNVADPPRMLFSGLYLRNNSMLARIVPRLAAAYPDARFDLLVPVHGRDVEGLRAIARHPAVVWHAGLSDLELREMYQRSYILLLPMSASGANTAIVEALASGLPIVTTDVGGVRDYGGGTVFPVVADNDDDAMVALIKTYLDDRSRRDEVAREARKFAEQHLAWPAVATAHIDAYRALLHA